MKRRARHRSGSKAVATVPPKDSTVYVMLPVKVKDLSKALGIKAGEILGVLVQNSIMTTINGTLDQNAVELIALEFNREIQFKRGHSEAELLEDDETPVPALAALDKEGLDTQGTAPRETAR